MYSSRAMTLCPKCGVSNPPERASCGICGMLLPVLTVETANKDRHEIVQEDNSAVTDPDPPKGFQQAGRPLGLFKQTMLGIAPGSARTEAHETAEASLHVANPTDSRQVLRDRRLQLKLCRHHFRRCLVWHLHRRQRPPRMRPIRRYSVQVRLPSAEGNKPLSLGSNKGTLLGVAIPGIAPVNPGVDKTPIANLGDGEPQFHGAAKGIVVSTTGPAACFGSFNPPIFGTVSRHCCGSSGGDLDSRNMVVAVIAQVRRSSSNR